MPDRNSKDFNSFDSWRRATFPKASADEDQQRQLRGIERYNAIGLANSSVDKLLKRAAKA